MNEWLTIREYAKLEHKTRGAIYHWIHKGWILNKYIKYIGNRCFINREALTLKGKAAYCDKYVRKQITEETIDVNAAASELIDIVLNQKTGYYEKLQIAEKLGVSVKTLYYWKKTGKVNRNLQIHAKPKLVDSKYPPEWRQKVIYLYAQPYKPTMAQVYEQFCYELQAQGISADAMPSLRTVQEWLKRATLEKPAELCYLREGEQKWADKYAPCIRRDWSLVPCGDTWVGDHHELDLFVIDHDGKIRRPWLTAWMDAHSRAIVGYNLNFQPSALEIALALRQAIFPDCEVPWRGLPNCLYVDNGKDYKSKQLNGDTYSVYKANPDEREWGLIQELGITMRHAQKYHAQSKHIERFFRTLERRWINLLPGYCGNNPKNRPKNVEEDIKRTQEYLDSAGERGEKRLLWWWEFEEEFDCIIQAYNNKEHQALDGLTPVQAYMLYKLKTVKTINQDTFDLIMLPCATRKIQTDGIHFSYKKQNNIYSNHALFGMEGQTVEIRYNPQDLKEIIVLKNSQYICRATAIEGWKPFAETEEEKAALAEYLEGRARLRKEYREKRKALAMQDPRLFIFRQPEQIENNETNTIQLINRYDKAGKEVKEEETTKAVNELKTKLILFRYQKKEEQ